MKHQTVPNVQSFGLLHISSYITIEYYRLYPNFWLRLMIGQNHHTVWAKRGKILQYAFC